MNKITKNDRPLLRQFKKWAKRLLDVNPGYVTCPSSIVGYIKGPNWDDSGEGLAHYRECIMFYGGELLEFFEGLRAAKTEEAEAEYRKMIEEAGIEETDIWDKPVKKETK